MCQRTILLYGCTHTENVTVRCGLRHQWSSLLPKRCRSSSGAPEEQHMQAACTRCKLVQVKRGRAKKNAERQERVVQGDGAPEKAAKVEAGQTVQEPQGSAVQGTMREEQGSPKADKVDEPRGTACDVRACSDPEIETEVAKMEKLLAKMTGAVNGNERSMASVKPAFEGQMISSYGGMPRPTGILEHRMRRDNERAARTVVNLMDLSPLASID